MHADARKKILEIMNATLRLPREERKENGPVSEKLHVLPQKRARFVGVGGYNLRTLMAETGVSVSPIDETNFQVFAPNQLAMDEANEKIEELLNEDVSSQPAIRLCFTL